MKSTLVLLFLLASQLATSQIAGKILDTANNEPLEYATAALYNQKDKTLVTGVVTNLDGLFLIIDSEIDRFLD